MAHQVNVRFSDQAYRTVQDLAARRGVSMGEIMRQAISVYAWAEEERLQGGHILVEKSNGEIRQLLRF